MGIVWMGRIVRMALATVFVVAAVTPASAQTPLDDAFITVENVERTYGDMPKMFDHALAYDGVLDGKAQPVTPAMLDALRQSAASAFRNDAVASIKADVARAGAAGTFPEFPAAAARLRAATDAFEPIKAEQAAAFDRKMAARYAARGDQAGIERLIEVMALPELAAEQNITVNRMAIALEVLRGDMPDLHAGMDEATMRKGIAQLVDRTREASRDRRSSPYDATVGRDTSAGNLLFVLLDTSPEDVAALLAFYESPTGRAKRAALLGSFAKANDEAFRAMLANTMLKLRG